MPENPYQPPKQVERPQSGNCRRTGPRLIARGLFSGILLGSTVGPLATFCLMLGRWIYHAFHPPEMVIALGPEMLVLTAVAAVVLGAVLGAAGGSILGLTAALLAMYNTAQFRPWLSILTSFWGAWLGGALGYYSSAYAAMAIGLLAGAILGAWTGFVVGNIAWGARWER